MDYLLQVLVLYTFAESANCLYPRLEDDYNSKGLICAWTEEDFYYDAKEGEWILYPKDENDNYLKAKSRKRYWKKRDDK